MIPARELALENIFGSGEDISYGSKQQPFNSEEYAKLITILRQNKNKQFVDRILNPIAYPLLDFGDGSFATHMMSWGAHPDRGYMVYPTVIMDDEGIRQLNPEEAYRHAVRTNELIKFGTEQEADWFSKNYKKVWGPLR